MLDRDKRMMLPFYHEEEGDTIWWTEEGDFIDGVWCPDKGAILFSFDKKKVYNLWTDYPHNMTPEEVEIFDKENAYWANFFKDRKTK